MPLTSPFYAVGGTAAALTAFSLVLSLRGVRRRSVLHIWIAVALLAFLGDVVASLTSTGRYTVGWYFGRVVSMVAAAILLMVFLGQSTCSRRLQEVGSRLIRCVRSGDTVSRLGGDEFVIALPEIARLEEVQATAEKIIRILSEPIPIAGHLLKITASIGIAISKPEAQFDATELLARADVAMYAAKKAGRNRYCFSS